MILKLRNGRFILYALLYVCTLIMIITISQYVSFSRTVGFLQFKQQIIGSAIWRSVFYTHVFTCFVCLFAGLTQFSKWILVHHTKLHRTFGWVYVFNIVFVNFPAGLVLAVYANGNLPGKIAFTLLDTLWLYFTVNAVKFIVQGDVKRHRENMIRSFALTLSALTLRGWKIAFTNFTAFDYNTIYILDAWLGFSLNLLFAEIIIRRRKISALKTNVADN